MVTQKEDIKKTYKDVLRQIKQDPGSEKTLNSLVGLEGVIEDAIFDILQNYENKGIEIGNTKIYKATSHANKELRQTLESRIMNIGAGKKINIDQLLDKMMESLRKNLQGKNIEEILKGSKINYMKIQKTILPPDEIKKIITKGEGETKLETREGYNKFGLLLELLIGQGIYTDDLYVVIGKNKENQMRDESYVYIHIPRINKTILLNNGYGEASFVYDGYLNIESFIKNTKTGIKDIDKTKQINFDYKNPDNWGKKIISTLFVDNVGGKKEIGEKKDMKEFVKNEKHKYTKNELNNIKLKEIEEYFKEKSLEERKGLTAKERNFLKIGGDGLKAIASKYNIKSNPINNQEVWYNLLEEIFQEKIERFNKEKIEEYFKQKSLEERKGLIGKERQSLRVEGNGLSAIASKYYIKGNSLSNQEIWYDLLEAIFQEKIERVGKKKIEECFMQKSLEERKGLTAKERQSLKIEGVGLKAISSKYNIKGDPSDNQKTWYDLLEAIFQEKIERFNKEKIEKYFMQKSIEERKGLTAKERQSLRVEGSSLKVISKNYDIDGNPSHCQEIWYNLLEVIFQENIERFNKEKIERYFKQKSIEDRKGLTAKERQSLKVEGKGLNSLAREYGVNGDPIGNQEVWYNLLESIFQENIERFNKEEIENYFKQESLEKRKGLTAKERQSLEIEGKGLNSIAREYGIKGNPIGYQEIWYNLLEVIFQENIERFNKEQIEKYFKQKSLEERKGLTAKERQSLKIEGIGLKAISSKYNIKGNPIGYQEIWYDLLEATFQEKIER